MNISKDCSVTFDTSKVKDATGVATKIGAMAFVSVEFTYKVNGGQSGVPFATVSSNILPVKEYNSVKTVFKRGSDTYSDSYRGQIDTSGRITQTMTGASIDDKFELFFAYKI